MSSRTPIAPIAPSAALLRLDLRQEASFSKSIAGSEGNGWKLAWLVIKNQVFVPLLQGFIWAIAKDWFALSCSLARLNGAQSGRGFKIWLDKWLKPSSLAAAAVTPAKK